MVKRFAFLGIALLALASVAGCGPIHEAATAVEGVIKSPPETVVTAGKSILDFVLNLLGIFVHGALGGLFK